MATSKKTTPAKKKTPRFARTPSDTFQTLAVHRNERIRRPSTLAAGAPGVGRTLQHSRGASGSQVERLMNSSTLTEPSKVKHKLLGLGP